jgi:hypothetical protein
MRLRAATRLLRAKDDLLWGKGGRRTQTGEGVNNVQAPSMTVQGRSKNPQLRASLRTHKKD